MSIGKSSTSGSKYRVPALDKGLDILETLAANRVPMTQVQLSHELERGPNELYRMLVALERRGYLHKDPVSGAFSLTLRLFELAHSHSPWQGLLQAADSPMHRLSEKLGESCRLGVLNRGRLLVIAQAESPAKLRLSVEVGSSFPLLPTAPGRLLLASMQPDALEEVLQRNPDYLAFSSGERTRLQERLARIRKLGYEEAHGEVTAGVTDMSVLVGSPHSSVRAALTVAALTQRNREQQQELLPALRNCAMEIARGAGLISWREGVYDDG